MISPANKRIDPSISVRLMLKPFVEKSNTTWNFLLLLFPPMGLSKSPPAIYSYVARRRVVYLELFQNFQRTFSLMFQSPSSTPKSLRLFLTDLLRCGLLRFAKVPAQMEWTKPGKLVHFSRPEERPCVWRCWKGSDVEKCGKKSQLFSPWFFSFYPPKGYIMMNWSIFLFFTIILSPCSYCSDEFARWITSWRRVQRFI